MKKIIFIESSDIGASYTAEGCRRLGYDPLFICDIEKVEGDTRTQLEIEGLRGNLISVDSTSVDKIFESLIDHRVNLSEIEGVMTFLDSRIEVAVELGELLNFPSQLDSNLLKLKSKARVQEFIPQFSPPSIVFETSNIPMKLIAKYIQDFGKVIIKPTKMAGAVGIKIFDQETISTIESEIQKQNLPGFLNENEWICQAFLEGELISVEGFIENDIVSILGVSDRTKVGLTESRLEFPVDSRLSKQLNQFLFDSIQTLARRAQVQNSFFHIEFIVIGDSGFIIDANIGRLGGGPLGEMIPLSFGIDVSDFYAFVIAKSLNLPPTRMAVINRTNLDLGLRKATVGVCYGAPIDGFFEGVETVKTSSYNHTLVLNPNQKIIAMGSNNWSWIGIISGFKVDLIENMKQLGIKIDGKKVEPCY
jgi:hypothetical protein